MFEIIIQPLVRLREPFPVQSTFESWKAIGLWPRYSSHCGFPWLKHSAGRVGRFAPRRPWLSCEGWGSVCSQMQAGGKEGLSLGSQQHRGVRSHLFSQTHDFKAFERQADIWRSHLNPPTRVFAGGALGRPVDGCIFNRVGLGAWGQELLFCVF